MDASKADFLRYRFVTLLRQIPSDTRPQWGKMTLQQMIEHFADSVRIASGRTPHTEILTPPEQLDKMRAFLKSDKPFRPNTPNSLLPETPAPVRNPSVEDALQELQGEWRYFFELFEKKRTHVTRNPFFGDLNFEENVQLLHKHALHHLAQFGITPTGNRES
jgi:hypothetical protein